MKQLLAILLLAPMLAGAQGIYATHSSARPVREMVVRLSVPGGQDMNQQETVQFDSTGRAVSVTKRGFGGEVTYQFGPEQNVRAVVDQDGDTLEVHRPGSPGSSTYYAYRRPHQRSAAKIYHYFYNNFIFYEVEYYDRNGKKLRIKQFWPNDLPKADIRCRYNRQGDLVRDKETRYDEDGQLESKELTEYRYVYDAEGNWVRRDYLLDNKIRYTHTREITYW